MFQRCLPGMGVLALLGVLGAPGQLHAQHSRGGSLHGFRSGFQPSVSSGFRRGFTPSFGFTPGFGFDPRFDGRFFDPRLNRARFDRLEDRFENRFGFGRFDRFEDRFENRFRFGPFDPRFRGGFVPGLGFVPGF
jgi:hypothetical protein